MAFGDTIKKAIKRIAEAVGITDSLVEELMRDLQRELIKSDVPIKIVKEISDKIKRRIKEEKPKGETKKEQIIHIVYDELVNILGEGVEDEIIKKKKYVIMLIGLFGTGKTTTAAKLAKYYQKRGHSVILIGTDNYRPAAGEQLKQLSSKINIPVKVIKKGENIIKWYKNIENELKNYDIVIIDTAGRDSLSKELIEEIKLLKMNANPDKVLLVINADIGRTAEQQVNSFNEATGIDGIIVTKMDGTARGGGALVAAKISNAKIWFIGTGEGIDDIEKYNPKKFVGRMIGLGDIEALLEKAREAIDEKKAKNIAQRFMEGKFTLEDMYEQLEAMNKMGPLTKIISMIPGMSLKVPNQMIERQQEKIKKWKYIMQSMTKEEKNDPSIITNSRIKRIALGSGTNETEVRGLLAQYKKMKRLLKGVKNEKDLQKMMAKFGAL